MPSAETRFRLSNPERRIAALCEVLAELDVEITGRPEGRRHALFHFGEAELEHGEGEVRFRAEAPDLSGLASVKLTLIGRLAQLVPAEPLDVVWNGDGTELSVPPNFRLMRVVSARWVTPHMRRLTLAGEALDRFASPDHIHVKLLIAPDGGDPAWPTLDASGRLVPVADHRRPAVRTYTLRHVDPVRGEVEIDLVAHGDEGPGSRFALMARPGDEVGMMGPGGSGAHNGAADWILLVGDETALPAIARMAEGLPPDAKGVALIEVADAAEQQAIRHPPGLEIRWLHRGGAPAGTTRHLLEAALALPWPGPDIRVFAWAGCEYETFRALRKHWRESCGLRKEDHLALAYWRHGVREGEFKKH